MTNDKVISKRLLDERNRLGMTQFDLVKKINVTPTSISRYENGSRLPTLEILMSMGSVGYDINYILTGDKSTNELSTDEQFLLNIFRDTNNKRHLLNLVKACAKVISEEGEN